MTMMGQLTQECESTSPGVRTKVWNDADSTVVAPHIDLLSTQRYHHMLGVRNQSSETTRVLELMSSVHDMDGHRYLTQVCQTGDCDADDHRRY